MPKRDYLERQLEDGRPFLRGVDVSVADRTLAVALQFARFRELNFIGDPPSIRRWDADDRKRDPAASVLVV